MKVLVLGGGDSPEKEVSLRSAKFIAKAAREAGFDVIEADPSDGFEFFDKLPKDTIVLPILHGINGEDGVIQAELEECGLPFLGADSASSAACFDKWQTRQTLLAAGVSMPSAVRVSKDTYKNQSLAQKPHVIKIIHGGSSIGTLIVRDPAEKNQKQIDKLFELENDAVLEELVDGIEITVPILDQIALPPIEVRPPEGGEFDYDNKYNGTSAELCPPPSLSNHQIHESQKLAERVHKAMGCRHLSRVDTIMRPDGSFEVLEINTIPGLTDQSLYPKSAAAAGLSMPELVRRFVAMVLRDTKTAKIT